MAPKLTKVTVDPDTALATFWVDRENGDTDEAMSCPTCHQTEFEFSALPTAEHGVTELVWVRCSDCDQQWDAEDFIAHVHQC